MTPKDKRKMLKSLGGVIEQMVESAVSAERTRIKELAVLEVEDNPTRAWNKTVDAIRALK